jgi:hypothetical protein
MTIYTVCLPVNSEPKRCYCIVIRWFSGWDEGEVVLKVLGMYKRDTEKNWLKPVISLNLWRVGWKNAFKFFGVINHSKEWGELNHDYNKKPTFLVIVSVSLALVDCILMLTTNLLSLALQFFFIDDRTLNLLVLMSIMINTVTCFPHCSTCAQRIIIC